MYKMRVFTEKQQKQKSGKLILRKKNNARNKVYFF